MKIAIYLPGMVWIPSGSHRVVYEYANGLARKGHDVCIAYFGKSPLGPLSLDRALRRVFISARWTAYGNRPKWFRLDERVRTIRLRDSDYEQVAADIVVAAHWQVAEALGEHPALLPRMLYIVHHDETAMGNYSRSRVLATLNLPVTKVAVSKATQAAVQAMGVNAVEYIPNGIDLDRYRVLRKPDSRPRCVAMLYVQKKTKEPQTGLKAIQLAKARIPELRAIVFGPGHRPASLPKWIRYVRRAPDEALVRDIYNRAAVYLCSSRLEGFGLPLAEAMACGCAIVSTDCGGIRDFAEDGVTALLSPVGESSGLAENLCLLLSDTELKNRLVEQGLRRIRQFAWEPSMARMEQLMQRLVAVSP